MSGLKNYLQNSKTSLKKQPHLTKDQVHQKVKEKIIPSLEVTKQKLKKVI